MLQFSQDFADFAQAYQAGNYTRAQETATKFAAKNLEQAIAQRYGKDSRFDKTVQVVKNNGVLARELIHAALNMDPNGAKTAIKKATAT